MILAVEGRKRTFPLTGTYISVPYTSGDTEIPSEMSRTSVSSGIKTPREGEGGDSYIKVTLDRVIVIP